MKRNASGPRIDNCIFIEWLFMLSADLGSFTYVVPTKLPRNLGNKHYFTHITDKETKLWDVQLFAQGHIPNIDWNNIKIVLCLKSVLLKNK